MNGYATKGDLAEVKQDVCEVKKEVKLIRDNDLKHLSRNVAYLMGAVAVIIVIVGAILGAVLLW